MSYMLILLQAIFNALLDHPEIKLIVCRHEQNAGFMASAVGKLTGTPGVCIATSGPGSSSTYRLIVSVNLPLCLLDLLSTVLCSTYATASVHIHTPVLSTDTLSDLCTPLATATTEGDPLVALIGDVPRSLSLKHTHQSMRSLDMLNPISKKTLAIHMQDQTSEVILDAFRSASSYPKGAVAVSIPQDIAASTSSILPFPSQAYKAPLYGPGATEQLRKAKAALEGAKLPVLLLGMRASAPKVVYAIREFLKTHQIPVVETFQAAGAVSKDLVHLFYGRIGLFRNQPGDKLLARSDCILAVGYDPTEYDASNWNPSGKLNVVHVDYQTCAYDFNYQPSLELLGSIAENFGELMKVVKDGGPNSSQEGFLQGLNEDFNAWKSTRQKVVKGERVKPLHFVRVLQERVGEDTTVVTDVELYSVLLTMLSLLTFYRLGLCISI